MPKTLTFEQAARLANVSVETIRYWVKTKRLETVPIRISARSGKPYGKLVTVEGLENARPELRIKKMKQQHPGKLLTIREIARELRIDAGRVYFLVKRYGLERHYVDGSQYMVDGEELWQRLTEDPELWYLTLRDTSANIKL